MTRQKTVPIWGVPMAALVLISTGAFASDSAYDPLETAEGFVPRTVDLTVVDAARHREIPIRVYLPSSTAPAATVLFSHGLGGSREGSVYLGVHWAGRGYAAVFLQHPGSDTSVWKDKPVRDRMAAMQDAAGVKNFMLRVRDVSVALDQLARWTNTDGHVLAGRLDLNRVGMSGHSFGAVTTQSVSGQRTAFGRLSFTDRRIRAAIAFSPSSPQGPGDPNQAFGLVAVPWMLMTGTKDSSPIGNADAASRLAVYPALPPGGKYELVLDGAEHSAFTDRALPGDTGERNPNHHRAILALSTAFWDAWLRDMPHAKTWLDGDGPRSVLDEKDRWQRK